MHKNSPGIKTPTPHPLDPSREKDQLLRLDEFEDLRAFLKTEKVQDRTLKQTLAGVLIGIITTHQYLSGRRAPLWKSVKRCPKELSSFDNGFLHCLIKQPSQ